MSRFRSGSAVLVLAAAVVAIAVSTPAVAEFSLKGKSVTMLIRSEPGGGTDASGRLIARYLGKYLPGEPNMVVQNMPGAGGMTSLNHIVLKTQPDGLMVGMG